MSDKTRILGIPISVGAPEFAADPEALLAGTVLVTFVNPLACALDRRHQDYVSLLERFDYVLPDGGLMAWAARRATGRRVARQSFDMTSLAPPVLALAARRGLPVTLVGGRPGVARRAAQVLEGAVPELSVADAFAGYGDAVEEARAWLRHNPGGLVLCGMGAPLQERFVLGLREAGWSGTAFTCGGFFDQLSGGANYYPGWVDRLNLRAPYRLFREPRRLWRRYLVDYQEFARRFARTRFDGR